MQISCTNKQKLAVALYLFRKIANRIDAAAIQQAPLTNAAAENAPAQNYHAHSPKP
jgi:hypothetical protein